MPKNNLLLRMQAKKKQELREMQAFVIQLSSDLMLIAANEAFGFGRERAKRLHQEWEAVWREFGVMVLDDYLGDRDLAYTKERIDARLREILGDDLSPWEDRYGG